MSQTQPFGQGKPKRAGPGIKDHRTRTGIEQHELQVRLDLAHIQRNGNQTGAHYPEERFQIFAAIAHKNGDAFPGLHAK